MSLLRFDEINALADKAKRVDLSGKTAKECEDLIADLIEIAYVYGTDEAGQMLGETIAPSEADIKECQAQETEGKTFRQRVSDNFSKAAEEGKKPDLSALIDTEVHRAYNEAIIKQGKSAGAGTKTWKTMRDDKVRDSHRFLEGVTVPIDADFYVPSGSHGPYPGSFYDPEEDINCRCVCIVSK